MVLEVVQLVGVILIAAGIGSLMTLSPADRAELKRSLTPWRRSAAPAPADDSPSRRPHTTE